MSALLVGGCAAIGAAVGPLLNLAIDRLGDGRPLRPIVYRRPDDASAWLVVAVTAALFGLAAARFGASWQVPGYLVLFAALVALSVIDLRVYRLPDRITFPTFGVSVALVVLVSLGDGEPRRITYALVGMLSYFIALFIPHLLYPKGMGFGDVKLAALMGLYLGWLALDWPGAVYLVFVALIAGCLVGIALGLGVNLARRRRGAFPFGPALAVSCVGIILGSRPLLDGYYG